MGKQLIYIFPIDICFWFSVCQIWWYYQEFFKLGLQRDFVLDPSENFNLIFLKIYFVPIEFNEV